MENLQKVIAGTIVILIIAVRPDLLNSEMLLLLIGFVAGQSI